VLFEYFDSNQITPLIISGIIIFTSILTFEWKKTLSLLLLFLGTIVIGYFIANLDHFLILWDEQYHALVAKNLIKNPLKPILYADPLLDFSYKNWTQNHIWLHKQPLFLWQIASSIYFFGVDEISVRIPSIIMHAIIPIFIYRIGKIVLNSRTAYYGALLFATAYFPLELIAGRYSTDHNDIAFLFYTTASIWAWFEYKESQNKYWLVLIGFFSGCAVLVKWLMGLLVFLIWAITNVKRKFNLKDYQPIFLSFIISLIIFLPWQIYISLSFPIESAYEYNLTSSHFFQSIENHGENIFFHFTTGLKNLYGGGFLIPFILLCGIVISISKIEQRTYKISILLIILIVYIFYSVAATKMIAFTIIVAPFVYLGLGCLIDTFMSILDRKINHRFIMLFFKITIPMIIAFSVLNLTKIQNYHTEWKPHDNFNRLGEEIEMNFINSIEKNLADDNYVIFNSNITTNGNIPIMFYTNFTAYNKIPTLNEIERIKKKGKKVAVINLGNLPNYILNKKGVKILEIKDLELLSKSK
jgi:4-amino-4-deoxy-L-arabinose transferase-like glycosyltransferase